MIILILPTIVAKVATSSRRYNVNNLNKVPERQVTIVLGAGVLPNGEPTPYLKRRLETATALYEAGRTHKLLMSADNSSTHYNEPEAMKRYAISLGVRSDDIVLDYAGFNTYDSCFRAHEIFGLRELIIVSQGYHLPRAIMTCMGLGVDSVGVSADSNGRDNTVTYILREYIATDKALLQLLFKPKPRLLGDKLSI